MPNFVNTKVDPERLSMAARNIDGSLSVVENALRSLDDSLRNTLHSTWSGPASTQFFSQYTVDAQSFAALVSALRVFNEKLQQAAGTFDKADSSAGDLVNKLKIG